jgi:hypothetical protein
MGPEGCIRRFTDDPDCSDEQGTCEETEIENDFQKKCRKGAKFARTYGIFAYTRRDKLFIFVGVGSFHPLSRRIVSTTHSTLRNNSSQASAKSNC